MDKIKQYWMPAVAAFLVIIGLSDFSLIAILLGAGLGHAWWMDVRERSSIDKKKASFRVIKWLVAGIGLDMLFHGSAVCGVVVLIVDALWILGKLPAITKKFTSRVSNASVHRSKTFVHESHESGLPVVSEDERIKMICRRTIKGAWKALSDCDCSDAPLLKELKPHLKRCASDRAAIVSIETYPFYVGSMKVEVENRWWKRISTKLAPGSATGVEHQKMDIWSLTPGALEGTYSEEDCPDCHRTGRVKCPTCHGELTHWDCPDCHGEAGHMYECSRCDGKGEIECPDCHGKIEIECRECHGKGQSVCPDCQGTGKMKCCECQGTGERWENIPVTCPVCHGTGHSEGHNWCNNCGSSGKVFEFGKTICSKCQGSGKLECDTCHSIGHFECNECHGAGKVKCKKCHQTGKVTCSACRGDGELRCEKCNSTGIEQCHTCGGRGTVTCPKCRGDGAFAYVWNVFSKKELKGQTVVWSEADIPQDVLPQNEFYSENDVVGVTSLFAKESTKTGYDLELLDGISEEYRTRMEALFKDFTTENDLAKGASVSTHLLTQTLGIEKVDGIAKVVIQAHGVPSDSLFENAKYTVWINLSTGTLLKVSAEGVFPAKYALCFADAVAEALKIGNCRKRAPISLSLARMGSAIAMKDYSILAREGDGVEKSEAKSAFWNEFATQFGWVTTIHDDAFKLKLISSDNWHWVIAHLPKMMARCNVDANIAEKLLKEFPDSQKYMRLNSLGSDGIRRSLEHDPKLLALYDFSDGVDLKNTGLILHLLAKNASVRARLTTSEWVEILKTQEDKDGSVRKVAEKCDFSRFSPAEVAELVGLGRLKYPTAKVLDLLDSSKFTPEHWVLVLDKTLGDAETLNQLGFAKRIARYSDDEWVAFFAAVEKNSLSGCWYEDLLDWGRIAKLPLDKLIPILIGNSTVEEHVKLDEMRSKLEVFDWTNVTDDQRVDFAIGHKDLASIVLKCGFDPNKIRPWCLDIAYDRWPEMLATFKPGTYDWSQCTVRNWAQTLYGHPEFKKYCPFDTIDWHKLDSAPIKYWKWALGAFGEKIAPLFSKWGELDEERWNDIIKKQPALAEYKKKYGKKS
jgi:hypothetical protein